MIREEKQGRRPGGAEKDNAEGMGALRGLEAEWATLLYGIL